MTQGPPRSVGEQARLEDALRDLFERRISFNHLLGLRVESLDPESIRFAFDMRPDLVGHYLYGRLHGGVISSTLDAAGGFALMVAIAQKHPADSTEQVLARFARLGTIRKLP